MNLNEALAIALDCMDGDRHTSSKCGDDDDADMLAQAMEKISKLKTLLYPNHAQKDRAQYIRQWLANEVLTTNGDTPPEFPWFGYETDKDLLDAVDAEMATGLTQVDALKVMLHA